MYEKLCSTGFWSVYQTLRTFAENKNLNCKQKDSVLSIANVFVVYLNICLEMLDAIFPLGWLELNMVRMRGIAPANVSQNVFNGI